MNEVSFRSDLKVAKFPAPQGSKRKIVFDYYMKMATIPWIAPHDLCNTWAPGTEKDYGVKLNYKGGKTYYGVVYANTKADYDQFAECIDENGVFHCDSYYYTEIVGNHCSSSMFLAYQQIIPLGWGTLRPSEARRGLTCLPANLKNPGAGVWVSKDLFDLNGEEAIYEAYATLEYGDILFFCKHGSGHVRMVSDVDVKRDENGKIDPENSYVITVENCSAWYTKDENSTWHIDKRYSFARLFKTLFMPITLDTFHDNTPITDAYMFYDGNNTPETLKDGLKGVIESNYPLNYVKATIKDENGNIVKKMFVRNLGEVYTVDIAKESAELGLFDLPAGTYEYKLRAGIARGVTEFEKFSFTV